jgi:hypothetical protein
MVLAAVACIWIVGMVLWWQAVKPRDVAWEHFKRMNPHADKIEYWRFCLDKQQEL